MHATEGFPYAMHAPARLRHTNLLWVIDATAGGLESDVFSVVALEPHAGDSTVQ